MKKDTLLTALPFLLPNLLGFFLFTLGPVAVSLGMAFTDWDLTRNNALSGVPISWVGIDNFKRLLSGAEAVPFWHYLGNTLFLMLGLPVSIVGSLVLALCLDRHAPLRTFFRTVYYLPSITAGVALLLLWKALLRPEGGLVNQVLHAVGLPEPAWLASVVWAKPALMLITIWGAIGGSNMILFLAGLSQIPEELREAAVIDGANGWQRFRHVTWPQLAPVTFFIVILSMIGGLQGGFEQAQILTQGGPAGSTTTLSYFIYQKGFQEFQLGLASAIAWVLFLIVFSCTALQWKFGNPSPDA
ncbi:carbohydrate ABC transporter membrane protein 1, CUT1 family [Verrucomicrobium sp. GAS474]|uniref:carbohydrate ABC transporter permease n=1 Tax=Verrucomicrobium sp. GAS474 TaxID=1882831 RepID=UPI000879CDDB|nr:sugar ABC transporter permease [Verrucomicrobium sp. GAS474]SDT94081.1 carbohydrate ABC transporter membrane protein 1, CUT1 family [Verrucomicrobium sp. GAS474]